MLLNLRYNETIASFANAAGVGSGEQLRASATKAKPGGGACTCIAFRTGQPHRPALPLFTPIRPPAYQPLCTRLTPAPTCFPRASPRLYMVTHLV